MVDNIIVPWSRWNRRIDLLVCVDFELILEITAPYGVVIIEQLQLQARLFDQDTDGLVEMTEILGVENNVSSKAKMRKIKIIRRVIDNKMQGDETVERSCLKQLLAYVKGTVPTSRKN